MKLGISNKPWKNTTCDVAMATVLLLLFFYVGDVPPTSSTPEWLVKED